MTSIAVEPEGRPNTNGQRTCDVCSCRAYNAHAHDHDISITHHPTPRPPPQCNNWCERAISRCEGAISRCEQCKYVFRCETAVCTAAACVPLQCCTALLASKIWYTIMAKRDLIKLCPYCTAKWSRVCHEHFATAMERCPHNLYESGKTFNTKHRTSMPGKSTETCGLSSIPRNQFRLTQTSTRYCQQT